MDSMIAMAPAKAILFGEHYVVYGARAIVCGITPYNTIWIKASEGKICGLKYETDSEKIFISENGEVEGSQILKPAAAVYGAALEKWPGISKLRINAIVKEMWPLKGVGNSASLSAALVVGLANAVGKTPNGQEIFDLVQKGEEIAHGGRASGVDACAATYGGALAFERGFEGKGDTFSQVKINMDDEWGFLLASTKRKGIENASTSLQTAKFARAHGLGLVPSKTTKEQRMKVCEDYEVVIYDAIKAMESGDMEKLADCMNSNHSLLSEAGVSSEAVEQAIRVALKSGASGAKLTGAGGEGSAVLILGRKEKMEGVAEALGESGFPSYRFSISGKGACVEEKELP